MSHSPPEHLIGVAAVHFGSWLCLTMQPALVAFDGSQMIEARRSVRVCAKIDILILTGLPINICAFDIVIVLVSGLK